MLSVLIVSAVVLLLFFRPFERGVLKIVMTLSERKTYLVVFLVSIFVLPLALLFIR